VTRSARRPGPQARRLRLPLALAGAAALLLAGTAGGQRPAAPGLVPVLGPGGEAGYIRLVMLFAAVSLAPAVLACVTAFARLVIVLFFVRAGLGTQQIPPNTVVIGLAIFLTVYVMAPTWRQVRDQSWRPYAQGRISLEAAAARAEQPLRNYMFGRVRTEDLDLFVRMGHLPAAKTRADVPTRVLVPAFVIGELRAAFIAGFLILLPFVVVDVLVASTISAAGLVALPPAVVALPFKVLLFVLADGWRLLAQSLVQSG